MSKLGDLYNAAYGNVGQKVLGTIGNLGTMAKLPEMGVSELFGTATAQASEPSQPGDTTTQGTGTQVVFNPNGSYKYMANGQEVPYRIFLQAGGTVPVGYTADTNGNLTQTPTTSGGTQGGTGTQLGSVRFTNPYTNETKVYNLDDPTEAGAFYADKLSALQTQRDELVSQGKKTSDKQIAELNTQLNDTYTGAKQYVDTYLTNVNQFGDQYQLGNVKRQQFFAGLSPNAYQSSQGTSAAFAENQYVKGLAQYAQEAQNNVGQSFLENTQANKTNPGAIDYSTIDQNSVYGRNINAIKGSQQDVASAFNNYVTQQNQNVTQQADTTANSLGGVNSYGYATKAPTMTAPTTTDTSGITPYTTFQQGNVQVPVGQQAPVVYNQNPINTQAPLEAYLGQNKLSAQAQDYLKSYLAGKV